MEIYHVGNWLLCGGMANNGSWRQTVVNSCNRAVMPVNFC